MKRGALWFSFNQMTLNPIRGTQKPNEKKYIRENAYTNCTDGSVLCEWRLRIAQKKKS